MSTALNCTGPPPSATGSRVGMLVKKRIDPVMHAKVYFGEHSGFRILAVGEQGTAELDKDHNLDKPLAVYPTWEYGENFNILEEMVSSPIGMDPDACMADVPLDERPVVGQPHRVVITNLPNAHLSGNRPFYRHLKELQEEVKELRDRERREDLRVLERPPQPERCALLRRPPGARRSGSPRARRGWRRPSPRAGR